MSSWAFRCQPCAAGEADWFVAALDVESMSPDTRIIRVKVGSDWKCALLDRTQTVIVEDQLLRTAIASHEEDCPQCAEMLTARTAALHAADAPTGGGDAPDPLAPKAANGGTRVRGVKVQAAAISLQGNRLVVVAVPMSLVASPGECVMAIEELQPYFGGAPIVLMAQHDDGSPRYQGPGPLLELLADVPLEQMPWKEFSVG